MICACRQVVYVFEWVNDTHATEGEVVVVVVAVVLVLVLVVPCRCGPLARQALGPAWVSSTGVLTQRLLPRDAYNDRPQPIGIFSSHIVPPTYIPTNGADQPGLLGFPVVQPARPRTME